MHSIRKSVLTFACVLMVAGCASYDEEMPRETVYSYSDPQIGMTYSDMAREMSTGSVQVYGLDGAMEPLPPSGKTVLTPPAEAVGVPSSVDPNVTVYPLFAGSVEELQRRSPPAIQPPSASFRPMESPFGGPLQTPAPLEPIAPVPYSANDYVPAPMSAPLAPRVPESSSKVYFRHGSSSLNASGKQVVDYVGRSNAGGSIVVEGHASERTETLDPVEQKIVNLKMSMDRAFKVSSQLIREGVPAEAIETKAYGDTRPADYADESHNRRVEIKAAVLPQDQNTASSVTVDRGAVPELARY